MYLILLGILDILDHPLENIVVGLTQYIRQLLTADQLNRVNGLLRLTVQTQQVLPRLLLLTREDGRLLVDLWHCLPVIFLTTRDADLRNQITVVIAMMPFFGETVAANERGLVYLMMLERISRDLQLVEPDLVRDVLLQLVKLLPLGRRVDPVAVLQKLNVLRRFEREENGIAPLRMIERYGCILHVFVVDATHLPINKI